ncbi:choice-of-anchor P family protein [Kitasatospora sp. NPDC057500]|uniref:choice-of-anchor P family protein n=1 Tax=Kitasatospora sp. NPDC057500 TaxID=3346151 RepID=UPI0036896DBC
MRTRFLAGSALAAALLTSVAGPAYAALTSPEAYAYVVSADAFGSLASVPPTPTSTYPPGGTTTLAGLSAGPFATNDTLTATTAGDPTTGTSSASATVDSLGIDFGPLGSAALTGINSTCTATPSGATGSGTIASGTVTLPFPLPPVSLQANAPANTTVSIPGIGTAVLNEQTTDADGVLSVNAVHFTLLPALNGANLIIGHAECGGASPAVPIPMINAQVASATGATVLAAGLGIVYLRRRNSGNATTPAAG